MTDVPQGLLDRVLPLLRDLAANLPPLTALSLLDVVLLITLGAFALDGFRRGFVLGALDVGAIMLTLGAAVSLYPVVGSLLDDYLALPGTLGNVLGFTLVFVLAWALYQLAASLVRALLAAPFAALPPLRLLNEVAGLLPGFVKGAVVVALLAAALRSLPMGPGLRGIVEGSAVLDRTAPVGRAVAPDLPPLLGRLGLDLTVVAPPPQAPTSPGRGERGVQFPPGLATEVDPTSELRMLELLNAERAASGLATLTMDDRLRAVARGHSEEMFRLSYFAHESPVSGTPFDRLRAGGVRFGAAGENLAYAPNVEAAHRGLMNSPDHRKNILTPAFRRVGIGVLRTQAWGRMFTQAFTD